MKTFLFLLIATIPLLGCQKKEAAPEATEQEVVFNATVVIPGNGLKSAAEWECKDLAPDYAHIIIDGTDYFPAVFQLDGNLYTQAIKLETGDYTVSQFLLMDDGGTPRETNTTDDQIVMGTPAGASPYATYISKPVSFNFSVEAFTKEELDIEVLCFLDHAYLEFGFDWFAVTELVVREQCFFGDFCVKHPADYDGSYYENQSTGLQIDMPAIFKIIVKKNGVPVPNSPFTNATTEANWGVGQPVCVQYPDNINAEGEEFTFELLIYVRSGNTFIYKHFHTWTTQDDSMIDPGEDGVVDFVLGNCNLTEPDLQLAPYQNLPVTANISITNPADPGFWRIYINSVSPVGTYDLPVRVNLTGWCGDINQIISNGNHNMNVYSSLYSTGWPAGMPFTLGKIAKVNWLFNHLENFGMSELTLTNDQGDIIQDAIWMILNGRPAGVMAMLMASNADSHEDFVPLPGGWAAVLFIKSNQPQKYQLIFTMVDP